MYTYENRVAFLTGALGLIGKEYTKGLLQNKIKGIALVDIIEPDASYQQELESTYGGAKIFFIQTDVGNKSTLKEAFEATVKHFGQLDIVINNAGFGKDDDYEMIFKINFMAVLHGTLFALKEYLPKYKKGPGVIVNTSSILGVLPATCFPNYTLSKHAVTAIGVCYEKSPLCLENDIRILTICPGPTFSNIYKRELHPILINAVAPGKKAPPAAETAEYLKDALINLINEGDNGSVWIFNEGKGACKINNHQNQKIALDYWLS